MFHILAGALNPKCGDELFTAALEAKKEDVKEAIQQEETLGLNVDGTVDTTEAVAPSTAPEPAPASPDDEEGDAPGPNWAGLTGASALAAVVAVVAALLA